MRHGREWMDTVSYRVAQDESKLLRILGVVRIAESRLVTIAAVNGAAVGAGMNALLVCDVVIAGESAKFDSRFLQIGLGPGGGHYEILLGGHTAVGCGIHITGDNLVWVVQDFR